MMSDSLANLPSLLTEPSALSLGDAGYHLAFAKERDTDVRPLVTIAIPTFNRPHLLRETLESVWSQEGFTDYDVIIVDNASTAENVGAVLALLRDAKRPVRYYVNDANMGVFRNWNRCLDLAQGQWVSILNDDDLLKPTFLRDMMREIDDAMQVDAMICRAELLDQRAENVRTEEKATTLHARIVSALRFRGRARIRLTPKRLFWANIAGSSLGSLYRRQAVMELGGFDPDEAPIADYVLNVRLAARGRFLQTHRQLAKVRLQVNETMNPDTLKGVLVRNFQLRSRLITEGLVPKRWSHWLRPLLAHELGAAMAHWHQSPSTQDVAHILSIAPPNTKARWMYLTRILYGGV
ncbi:glycosyltransferase family 2 protein [Sphingomonas zeae]|jgi:glycosyltransferase involved in cell wall biosynthesis|uniref:Glycosyltransferase family 2 protein n=2 Tax=Sphingomonas zeae TaxID=1646122 RepID=A0A7Y6B3M5_9SPHN|nr:glycosyltransferase family 2 protein [Sphingomonas zeae]NUU45872.1 glycosyltransferase family 2 protein [Sphingomonas zeae]